MSPFVRRTLDAVVPAVCRWLVSRMRAMEEMGMDPAERWEWLRQDLERRAQQEEHDG